MFEPQKAQDAAPSFGVTMSYGKMTEYIDIFSKKYKNFHVTYLGKSMLGKNIPLITLGKGKKTALYIGAHHGMEWITTSLLLKFACEYCEMLEANGHIGHTSISYLNASRKIQIIPMLNPDGVDYETCGTGEDNPLFERVIKMNGGSDDFLHWQANARGVDLNHNYDAGFEEYRSSRYAEETFGGAPSKWCGDSPESEPESGALANFARFGNDIEMFISFHSQGEEIYYGDRFDPPKQNIRIGQLLSGISGYKLCETGGSASYGGFTDWVVRELRKPAYTFECGKGENPLPCSSLFEIYYKLRRLLFEAPMII